MNMNKPKRRSAWLAGLMSLLQPGLGQLYCGRWRAAALFYGLILSATGAGVAGLSASSPFWFAGGWLILLCCLLVSVAAMIDAALGARRIREFRPVWYARWYSCVVAFAVVVVISNIVGDMIIKNLAAYHVPAVSMAPTLRVGDYFLVQRGSAADVRPCDVVVFRKPERGVEYVKRVIALPGDRVGYIAGRLHLNGAVVPRQAIGSDGEATIYRETLPSGCSYLIWETSDRSVLDDLSEITVPPVTFYVLGDNRDDSIDSRLPQFGPIHLDDYRGRAMVIYWSKDPSRIGALLVPSTGDFGNRANEVSKPKASSASP
jgi:signal peptidase I